MFVIMPKPSCAAYFAEAMVIEMLKERKKPKKLRRSKILKKRRSLKDSLRYQRRFETL